MGVAQSNGAQEHLTLSCGTAILPVFENAR